MKKALILMMIVCSLILTACSDAASVGIIGGSDGLTAIYVDEKEETKIYDDWGIRVWAEDATSTGITFCFEQSGGAVSRNLQTGAPYTLEKWDGKEWLKVEYKNIDEVPVWNSMAYIIKKNETAKQNINFEFIYNELTAGKYRVGKEIMDFRKPGDYDSRIYYAEFVIE